MENPPPNCRLKSLEGLIIGSFQNVRGNVSESKLVIFFKLHGTATVGPKMIVNCSSTILKFNHF